MSKIVAFYYRAKKAVHGALVSAIPVLIVCEQTDASWKMTVLSTAAAVLGVGGSVYQATNQE